MNIKPRLDQNIPKSYLYITVGNSKLNEERLEEIKSEKDKGSMKSKKQYKEYIEQSKQLHEKLTSGDVINLYSNKETINDFTRDTSYRKFENNYVIKINPICMLKTFSNYGNRDTYELYSFTVEDVFYDQKSLMKSLKKDGLLSQYILNHYLNLTYGNQEYIDPRNEFVNYVIDRYPENRPSFASILNRFKAKDYESSATYQPDEYKIKYYREAYDKGFIKLNDEYQTESTLIFLLKNRMFDLLKSAADGLCEYGKESLLEFGDKYKTYESVKCIKEELMKNMDNKNCKWLYELCGFKSPGYQLTISYEDDWRESELIESKIFEKVEDLKKYLIRNYECDMDKVYNSKFDDLYVRYLDETDGDWMKVEIEYVE